MDEKNKTFEEVLKENRFLISIETVKIKDFIFSTNKLKLIRGASYLFRLYESGGSSENIEKIWIRI